MGVLRMLVYIGIYLPFVCLRMWAITFSPLRLELLVGTTGVPRACKWRNLERHVLFSLRVRYHDTRQIIKLTTSGCRGCPPCHASCLSCARVLLS